MDGDVIKVLDCAIVIIKFELQSHYYVNFQINTFAKGLKLFIR